MTRCFYDVVTVTDTGLFGGQNGSVAEEIRAHSQAGYTTAILPMGSHAPRSLAPSLARVLDDGLADLVEPDAALRCGLLLARGPGIFRRPPPGRPNVVADEAIMAVNAFPYPERPLAYDPWEANRAAEDLFSTGWQWCPISETVRSSLRRTHPRFILAGRSWYNILHLNSWKMQRGDLNPAKIRLGRHTRDDPLKWPDRNEDLLGAYPPTPPFEVVILGGAETVESRLSTLPENWTVLPFGSESAREFLNRIDIFVFFHSDSWREAFGRSTLEAMATGAICVLPPYMRETFGDAAYYGSPQDVPTIAKRLAERPDEVRRLREATDTTLRRQFSWATHVERLGELIGPPRRPPSSPLAQTGGPARPTSVPHRPEPVGRLEANWATGSMKRAGPKILFFTDNGRGLGHLTRLMAIARRTTPAVRPFFLTMSAAHPVVENAGFPVEYFQKHKGSIPNSDFEHLLEARLTRLLERTSPAAVVVDHVNPPPLLGRLRDRFPGSRFVWTRRGLWKRDRNRQALEQCDIFDMIIEPLDIAAPIDVGHTPRHPARRRIVPPTTLFEENELVPRKEAREALGMSPEGPAILIQLSDDDSRKLTDLVTRVRNRAKKYFPSAQLFAPLHILHGTRLREVQGVTMRPVYPLAPYLRAFDLAVSACGYNSFHELVMASIPSIFIPKQSKYGLDDQARRGTFAAITGCGWSCEGTDPSRLDTAMQSAADPVKRDGARAALSTIRQANGAANAASIIEELAHSTAEHGRPPHDQTTTRRDAPEGAAQSLPSGRYLPARIAPTAARTLIFVECERRQEVQLLVERLVDQQLRHCDIRPLLLSTGVGTDLYVHYGFVYETAMSPEAFAEIHPEDGYRDYLEERLQEMIAVYQPARVWRVSDPLSDLPEAEKL